MAVKARLETLGLTVHDTAVVKDGAPVPGNYYILYGGNPDTLLDERLTGGQVADMDREIGYVVRSVSLTADGARRMAADAFGVLVGWRPTITGRTCRGIRHGGSDPARPDRDVSPPIYYADDDYDLISSRV